MNSLRIPRNPQSAPEPATYHHGIEITGDVRTLYVAGQIGTRPDGTTPSGIAEQTRAVFANLRAVLDASAMTLADIVKTTVYLVDRQDRQAFSEIRAEEMAGVKNASTLLFVAGLALPELLVEIEAIAVSLR